MSDQRQLDKIILQMEAIELITGSRILSINFNEYDALVSASGLQDPNMVTVTEEQIEAASSEQPA